MRRYILALLSLVTLAVTLTSGQLSAAGATVRSDAPAWLTNANGQVRPVGGAAYLGDLGAYVLNSPIVSIGATPSGNGYWLLAADGGLFAFGDAGFFGSMAGAHLNSPIVGIAATPSGRGYWMTAADGGIFAFGDARFFGSTGGTAINSSIVAMTATPTGGGYWLVAADGGVFAFGDAAFYGSMGQIRLNSPVVGISTVPAGGGYWLVGADGGIFSFGTAKFYGSVALQGAAISGLAPLPAGGGYQLFADDGRIFGFGSAPSSSVQLPAGSIVGVAAKPVAASTGGETAAPPPVTVAPITAPTPTTSAVKPPPTVSPPAVTPAPTAPPVSRPAPSPVTPTTSAPVLPKKSAPGAKKLNGSNMSLPSAGSTPKERAYNALAFYKGGSKASNMESHERWMGRKSNYWLIFLSGNFKSSLQVMRSSLRSNDSKFLNEQRTVIVSLNLTVRDGYDRDDSATRQLTAAKNGANDWFWEELGTIMRTEGLTGTWPDGRPKMILRIAWEHNGNWFPWSARPGRAALFKAAYRRAVQKVESKAGDVTTAWGSSTLQNRAKDLNASYPGDDVVDIIEVDVYDAYGGYTPNPFGKKVNVAKRGAVWKNRLNGTSGGLTGLQFFADFAREHKKGFAIGEFGVFQLVKSGQEVGGGDNPAWIQNIFDFAGAQENLVYVSYFEVDRQGSRHRLSPEGYSGGVGSVKGSQFPKAAAKFLQLWGDV